MRKEKGGWGLTYAETMCRAILLYQMWIQSQRVGEITAEWQRYWNPNLQRGNPPHVQRIPNNPHNRVKPYRAFRTRVYETLRTIQLATNKPRDVRITLLYPTTDWDRVWSNLHATWAADAFKANWFRVIHDILPTNERLTDSALCSSCGER
jgi:hypothetical protein